MMTIPPKASATLTQKAHDSIILSLPLLIILIAGLIITEGNLTYTLDDPYIHLALARQIADGHYGLQAGAYAAPSSSIIWPFLLAPFSHFSWFEQAPLIINTASCLLTLSYIRAILEKTLETEIRLWHLLTIGLVANIYGLVFTGMEHNLQILLTCMTLYYVIMKPTSLWLALTIAIMPLIRYESLAISLPLGAYLTLRTNKWYLPAIAMAASLAAIIAFSLFLKSIGLEALPSSIMAKAGTGTWTGVLENISKNIHAHYLLPVIIGAGIAFHARRDRWLGISLMASAIAFYTLGKSGWYGRYETFFVIYAGLLCSPIFSLVSSPALRLFRFLYIFLLTCQTLFICTLTTPLASKNINDQQATMAKLAKWLAEPVAVNDLGLVALRSDQHVLDLWGLGSIEALRAQRSGLPPDWICDLMEKENVRVAMVYSHWFPEKPSCWSPVATLHTPGRRITAAGMSVSIYTTQPEAIPGLKRQLQAFSLANPKAGAMLDHEK